MGAELNDLSKEWPEVLCTMAKNWDTTIGQADLINTVALAVLYEVDGTTIGTLFQKLPVNTGEKIGWLDFCFHREREGRTIRHGKLL